MHKTPPLNASLPTCYTIPYLSSYIMDHAISNFFPSQMKSKITVSRHSIIISSTLSRVTSNLSHMERDLFCLVLCHTSFVNLRKSDARESGLILQEQLFAKNSVITELCFYYNQSLLGCAGIIYYSFVLTTCFARQDR